MDDWLNKPLAFWDISFPFTPLEFVLHFLIPFLLFSAGGLLLSLITRLIANKLRPDGQRKIRKITRSIFFLFIFTGILIPILYLFKFDPYKAIGRLIRLTNKPFYSSGNTSISLVTLLLIIPVFFCASRASQWIRRVLNPNRLNRFGLNAIQSFSLVQLIRYAAMAIVLLFGLSIIGIDLSAIGVLFGVLGIGIGFGMQSFIADFFAGMSIITIGLLKEGDLIRVDGNDGFVKIIRLMHTELTTFENETLIIPNSRLTHTVIHSYTYKDPRVIIVNTVSVSYDSDLDMVIAILQDVAKRNPWRHSDILVRVVEFADSGINLELRTCINDILDKWEAKSWTNLEIWRTFKKAGVEIPFPQRDLHWKEPKEMRPDITSRISKRPRNRARMVKHPRKVSKSEI